MGFHELREFAKNVKLCDAQPMFFERLTVGVWIALHTIGKVALTPWPKAIGPGNEMWQTPYFGFEISELLSGTVWFLGS
jgi:hypothetical protein